MRSWHPLPTSAVTNLIDARKPHMSGRAPSRRVVCRLVTAAFLVCGAPALSLIEPTSARANGIHCVQVAYEPGPWGTAPGVYKSCTDDQGHCVTPPDGSNDACAYMHRPR